MIEHKLQGKEGRDYVLLYQIIPPDKTKFSIFPAG